MKSMASNTQDSLIYSANLYAHQFSHIISLCGKSHNIIIIYAQLNSNRFTFLLIITFPLVFHCCSIYYEMCVQKWIFSK